MHQVLVLIVGIHGVEIRACTVVDVPAGFLHQRRHLQHAFTNGAVDRCKRIAAPEDVQVVGSERNVTTRRKVLIQKEWRATLIQRMESSTF